MPQRKYATACCAYRPTFNHCLPITFPLPPLSLPLSVSLSPPLLVVSTPERREVAPFLVFITKETIIARTTIRIEIKEGHKYCKDKSKENFEIKEG